MGIFGKIKNILFEPDEEELIEDMHVYTKEEVKESPKKEEVIEIPKRVEEPPIKTTNASHFSNVKRDIDIDYDDKKVLDEVPGVMEAMSRVAEDQARVVPKKEEERPSPFPSFDEKEFDRVNSRVSKNESLHKIKKENKEVENSQPSNSFRKANSIFSSTTTHTEPKLDSVREISTPTVKKPFKPSPVISPVYGILGENYRKDDIVDKKDGMKREKVIKPVVKEEPVLDDTFEVDIDAVRRKAYGTLDDIEKEMKAQTESINNDNVVNDNDITIEDVTPEVIDTLNEEEISTFNEVSISDDYDQIDDDLTLGDLIESNNKVQDNNLMVEDELEKEFSNDEPESYEIKEVSSEDLPIIEDNKQSEPVRPRLLDDMEKTSTLQILDDIEKELNSIKPISKDVKAIDEDEMKEKIEKSETLENDLFNLIDSMYEQGEEDEDA